MNWLTSHEEREGVLARLEGSDCPICDGTLERGSFDGTAAAVCDRCEAPAVRLWGQRVSEK